jgi:hypothetical protein
LFLKAAFRYATENKLGYIFLHGDIDQHHFLFRMLEGFGFSRAGGHAGVEGNDAVYVKEHPIEAPEVLVEPVEYLRK